jgi:predicted acetyltransferase
MTALTLRPARTEDAVALAANSLRCYPDAAKGLAWRAERYRGGVPYPIETMFVAEREGEVVGQARTIPYRGWLGGVEARVGGLAGVAVAPEARRTGVAGALVRHHLAELRATSTPWAFLYPFAPSFYAAMGWWPAARRLRWRLSPRALPTFPERRLVRRLAREQGADLGAVQAVYEEHCVRQNGSLSRPARLLQASWDTDRDQQHVVGVRGRGGALSGYLFYEMQATTPRPQLLAVSEWVALDGEAERALLGFLAGQADQADAVTLDTPTDHPLASLLDAGLPAREDESMPPEHHPLATLYSGAMARIVDTSAALAARGYPGRTGAVAFSVASDPLVPENVGTYTVAVEQGQARVTPGRAPGAPLVRGPVGPMSAVLVGGVGVAAAARLGLVTVEGALPVADALLALPPPYPLVVF